MKKNFYKKVHKYTFYTYISKFLWILIIPLLQNLLYKPQTLAELIVRFGFNILLTVILIFFAVANYKSISYKSNKHQLLLNKGFLVKRRFKINTPKIQCIYCIQTILPIIFNAAKLHIITPSSSISSKRCFFYLSRLNAQSFIDKTFQIKNKLLLFKSKSWRILLMSMTWGNSLTGLIALSLFTNKISQIFGERYSQMLYEQIDVTNYAVLIGIPPFLAGLASLMFAGWALQTLLEFSHNARYTAQTDSNHIIITCGVLRKTIFACKKENINAVTVKQTLLMFLFGCNCVYIHTLGRNAQKGDKGLFIPIERTSHTATTMKNVFNFPIIKKKTLKPKRSALLGYISLPAFFAAITFLGLVIYNVSDLESQIIEFVIKIMFICIFIWIIFRCIAHKNASVSLYNTAVEICYYKRLELTKTTFMFNKIQSIKIMQNPIQRLTKNCNIIFYIYSNNNLSFKIKNLKLADVLKITEEICNYFN